jgi:hypothetical protein
MLESEAFCNGVVVGINLFQQKIVQAAKRKEPVKIDDELYYVQNGRDRLREMVEKICR